MRRLVAYHPSPRGAQRFKAKDKITSGPEEGRVAT